MSGIVGLWHLDGRPADRRRVARMTDTLSHRGPDDRGVWTGESVGFGHRMLETTPESAAETQPLTGRGGELVVAADARIDNRDDLIGALRLDDRFASPITDSEVILAAYEKWEDSCPEHLVGAYAFILWDRAEPCLLCARDHLGINPLCYYKGPHHFVAASELKALFASGMVPRRINEERVAEHLVVAPRDATSTFYENVYHVPPAHVLTVSPASVRKTRYWTLDTERELRLDSEEAYAEARAVPRGCRVSTPERSSRRVHAQRRAGFLVHRLRRARYDARHESWSVAHVLPRVSELFGGEESGDRRAGLHG